MAPKMDGRKQEAIALIREGKLGREEISARTGVSAKQVDAYRAHVRMGTYGKSPDTEGLEPRESIISPAIEEMHDVAMQTTFGLERDLQAALRANIEQLEQGLRVIDGGKEATTAVGRIDVEAEDPSGTIVVIELKPGEAPDDSITQVLSYMGAVHEQTKRPVRGILVAGQFSPRVIFAARAVANLQLKKYSFRFSFETVRE